VHTVTDGLLDSLLRNVPGAVYRCALDRDWTMHLIGEEIERISGYPASDFHESAVRSFASVIHPADRLRVEHEVFVAVEKRRPFELEYRIVHRDGHVRWVLERGCVCGEWLDGVILDVTERRRGEEAVRRETAEAARRAELEASRARIVAATDEAMRRLERDLHDGAQQRLVAAQLALRMLQRRGGHAPEAAALLEQACEHLGGGLADLRAFARGLHPTLLNDRGLAQALSALASRAPLAVDVRDELGERLASPVELALYFTASEAITNAVKHAQATTAEVRIARRDGHVTMEVRDDGVGGASLAGSTGLRGLADRLDTVGGSLDVESPPGVGTRVVATVPV
jgi:signal transduction histidine kinase